VVRARLGEVADRPHQGRRGRRGPVQGRDGAAPQGAAADDQGRPAQPQARHREEPVLPQHPSRGPGSATPRTRAAPRCRASASAAATSTSRSRSTRAPRPAPRTLRTSPTELVCSPPRAPRGLSPRLRRHRRRPAKAGLSPGRALAGGLPTPPPCRSRRGERRRGPRSQARAGRAPHLAAKPRRAVLDADRPPLWARAPRPARSPSCSPARAASTSAWAPTWPWASTRAIGLGRRRGRTLRAPSGVHDVVFPRRCSPMKRAAQGQDAHPHRVGPARHRRGEPRAPRVAARGRRDPARRRRPQLRRGDRALRGRVARPRGPSSGRPPPRRADARRLLDPGAMTAVGAHPRRGAGPARRARLPGGRRQPQPPEAGRPLRGRPRPSERSRPLTERGSTPSASPSRRPSTAPWWRRRARSSGSSSRGWSSAAPRGGVVQRRGRAVPHGRRRGCASASRGRSPARALRRADRGHVGPGARTFVEVGPGSGAHRPRRSHPRGRPHRPAPLDRKGKHGVTSLQEALGRLAVAGVADRTSRRSGRASPPAATPKKKPAMTLSLNGSNYGKPYPRREAPRRCRSPTPRG
jgi:hypothetical protein